MEKDERVHLVPDDGEGRALVDDTAGELAEALAVGVGGEDGPPGGSEVVGEVGGQEETLEGGEGGVGGGQRGQEAGQGGPGGQGEEVQEEALEGGLQEGLGQEQVLDIAQVKILNDRNLLAESCLPLLAGEEGVVEEGGCETGGVLLLALHPAVGGEQEAEGGVEAGGGEGGGGAGEAQEEGELGGEGTAGCVSCKALVGLG